MLNHNSTTTETAQPACPLSHETKRKGPSQAQRAHELPSQVMPAMRRMIVGSFMAGRSVKQCAAEYNVTQGVILELVIRAEMEMRRVEMEREYRPTPQRLRLVA